MKAKTKYTLVLKESDAEARAEARKFLDSIDFIGCYYICGNNEELKYQIASAAPDIVVYGFFILKSYLEVAKKDICIKCVKTKNNENKMKKQLSLLLLEIGMIPHTSLYKYAFDAITVLIESKGRDCSVVKDLYFTVAEKNNTTHFCVECAIRKGLTTFLRKPNDKLKEFLATMQVENQTQISNGAFFHLIYGALLHGIK